MTETKRQKVTLNTLYDKMRKGEPITMITCYDYPMAYLVEQAGVDIVLVGDSLGMTILGYDSTLPVTQDVMMPHVQAVRRGTPNAWLIGDMPYMTYQPSVETAIRVGHRLMASGVDLEFLEDPTANLEGMSQVRQAQPGANLRRQPGQPGRRSRFHPYALASQALLHV